VNRIEILANDIAWLTNDSIAQLAQILVREYPTRADALETQIRAAFQESELVYNQEFDHE
jgi:hypothetical protein